MNLSPALLRCNPQLAALALLHGSAETAIIALCAAHPAIEDILDADPHPSLEHLANHVVERAMLLLDALDRYERLLHDHDRLCCHRKALDDLDAIF